jgi:hypothetical protein
MLYRIEPEADREPMTTTLSWHALDISIFTPNIRIAVDNKEMK